MQKNSSRNLAVSEVVGEMLMIGIVLILAAVFTSQLPNYLPSERSPSVTIMMSNDTGGNITLWHKGGDWVKVSTLKVIVSNKTNTMKYVVNNPEYNFSIVPNTQTFDLGSNITVAWGQQLYGNESVVLATDRAVLFTGVIGGEPT